MSRSNISRQKSRYSSNEPRIYSPGSAAYTLPPKGTLEMSPCRSNHISMRPSRSLSSSPLRSGYESTLQKENKMKSSSMRSASAGVSPQQKSTATPWTPRRPLITSTPSMNKIIPNKTDLTLSEIGIIDKQRTELELILGELRERDRELNEMVAGHQHQLLSWEEDRQRVLTLEHKSTRLQAELSDKTEIMRKLLNRLSQMESDEDRKFNILENTQKRLQQISEEHAQTTIKIDELQTDKDSLNDSIQQMQSVIGQMEAKEEELLTLLRLKDRDLSEASALIAELTTKLRRLDSRVQEKQTTSQERKKQAAEWKAKYCESKKDIEKIKGHLKQSKHENSNYKKEEEKYKEEIAQLKRELELSGEREKRKEELLESQKSKQERTDSELRHLRQLYDRQQKDLHLLHINLESTKDLLGKQREVYATLRRDSHASQMSDVSVITGLTNSTADKTLLGGVDLASMTTSKATSEEEHLTLPDKISPNSVTLTSESQNETITENVNSGTPEAMNGIPATDPKSLKYSIDSGVTSIADKSNKDAEIDDETAAADKASNGINDTGNKRNLHRDLQQELHREIQVKVNDTQVPMQRLHPGGASVDSPTQKLQRLLQESRQLVESLENSSLLNASFGSQAQ